MKEINKKDREPDTHQKRRVLPYSRKPTRVAAEASSSSRDCAQSCREKPRFFSHCERGLKGLRFWLQLTTPERAGENHLNRLN
jgi:hypothetical protein